MNKVSAYGPEEERNKMKEKTLNNTDVAGARKQVPDLQVFGDGDAFQLICKASSQSEGWMKSTKAMSLPNGVLVQVTTQQRNPDGSYAVAEALAFVPDICVKVVAGHNDGTGPVVTERSFGLLPQPAAPPYNE